MNVTAKIELDGKEIFTNELTAPVSTDESKELSCFYTRPDTNPIRILNSTRTLALKREMTESGTFSLVFYLRNS